MEVVVLDIKDKRGSVTIEATISLSAFMFAIVTILGLVTICTAQAKIGVALNTTAKEISQYSYLYGLTGFNESTATLADAAGGTKQSINETVGNVNTIFNEIENLGNTGNNTNISDPSSVIDAWDSISQSVHNGTESAGAIEEQIKDIAKDPKQFIFGIVKLLASEGLEEAKSRLVAAPLSKVMIQKHLKNEKNQSVEDYLKSLYIVPGSGGSYLDGLDFSKSTLFAYGSNEIRLVVTYKVKIIPLLPIKTEYSFTQSAVTHGWLQGDKTFKSASSFTENPENNSIWIKATVEERADLIRHMGIDEYKSEGYEKTKGLTDVQLYNDSLAEFIMISSMNPLYGLSSVDEIDEAAIKSSIERLSGKIRSTTESLNSVKCESGSTYQCQGANNKVVLVIPEDEGLKEKIQQIIDSTNTKGVEFEIITSYGSGINNEKPD